MPISILGVAFSSAALQEIAVMRTSGDSSGVIEAQSKFNIIFCAFFLFRAQF
jgi:hypothetical protein